MKKLKKLILVVVATLTAVGAQSQENHEQEFGKVQFRLGTQANQSLTYSVTYKGKPVILDSPLGMNIDNVQLGEGVQIQYGEPTTHSSSYANNGIHAINKNQYKEVAYTIVHKGGSTYFLDVRVFEDGVAIRYRFPATSAKTIHSEATSFTFPPATRVWYASGPFQYGWLQQYQDRLTDSIKGELLAPPATFLLPNGTYAAITEANLFNFHGAVLFGSEPNRVKFGFVENRGHLETGIITGLPPAKYWHEVVRDVPWIVSPKEGSQEIISPWRVLMLASNLNDLVNNDIVANVSNEPDKTLFPEGAKTAWIKPGRSAFTWLTEGDKSSIATYQKYIRGAKELGYESILVDEGWENWPITEREGKGKTKWQYLSELTAYGREQGVDIWVWRPSSMRWGFGKDIGLVDPDERANFMKQCAAAGVKGIKIDFFHTENLYTVNLMEKILKDAAREKLMVVFHGVNKPTGDLRTYPNLLAKEAVRGLECVGGENSWAPGPPWPYHNTVLPFTRWLAGAADYTPLNFRNFCPPSITFAHQLASIYTFTSPMLILAADMEDMLASPGRKFIESVAATWDETVVLPESRIGEIAAIARRKGDVWFLSVLNGEKATTFEASMDFLPKGRYEVEIASDQINNRKQIVTKIGTYRSGQKIREELMAGGGFVASFRRK